MESHVHADPVHESDHRQPSWSVHKPELLYEEQDRELPEQLLDELLQ